MAERDREPAEYTVTTCDPYDLSAPELSVCVSIIKEGGAVAVDAKKLGRAQLIAVARKGDEIVGVGSVKRVRPDYAASIAIRSGFSFAARTPELGYVAVSPQHWRRGLSGRLVEALLTERQDGLFATTYDDRMKRTLAGAGFVQKGNEWMGRAHRLSLWVKE